MAGEIRTKMNKEQNEAVSWRNGPLLVLGTPGSGKTTVIVNRIVNMTENLKVNPQNILVITFTVAAANSMKERYKKISGREKCMVRMGTFHSFFYWILRTAYPRKNWKVLSEVEKKSMIRKIMVAIDSENYDNDDILNSVLRQMDALTADLIDLQHFYATDIGEEDFRIIVRRYEDEKKKMEAIDFNDMSTKTFELLKNRPDILKQIQILYPYIMVDEFQDTNRIQYEILKLLSHPGDNLFAVGDDDQSIYGFRGARPDIMLSFPKEFQGAKVLQLKENYRCANRIVALSSQLIGHNKKRYPKALQSARDIEGNVFVSLSENEEEQNQLIVDRIRGAIKRGVEPGEIAVLFRTNVSPRRLIYGLKQVNVPFQVKDRLPNIFENVSVRPIMAYLAFANGDYSRNNFLAFMNRPVRYISRNMVNTEKVSIQRMIRENKDKDYLVNKLNALAEDLQMIRKLPPASAVNYIRNVVRYNADIKERAIEKQLDEEAINAYLDEFVSMIQDCKDYKELLQVKEQYEKMLLEQAESRRNQRTENAVQLMTMHSAKGLEFKEVHIMNIFEGEIPYRKAKQDYEIEEERRGFYVALTRGKDTLYLYSPKDYRGRKVEISRFMSEMNLS